ncbi:MerR family transcriptional regulator, partial [Streptomyces scabiei]|uniref:MerR family transcriptional regulator n=1 Tax=Streptomyces scabiei TaxID=1930 RepID=UPI0039EDF93B
MRIGELARATGTTARALRHYEQAGLISSQRAPNGYRIYDERAVVRVRNIRYLLAAGLVLDDTTVLLLLVLAGVGAGVAANTGHALLDQETEDHRRARTTEHLHAVVRVGVALGAVVGPVVAAAIGPHRLENGKFVFAHGGAAFVLMLLGALLLPLAALVLAKVDDRSGVPLRHDLRDALLGGDDPVPTPAAP